MSPRGHGKLLMMMVALLLILGTIHCAAIVDDDTSVVVNKVVTLATGDEQTAAVDSLGNVYVVTSTSEFDVINTDAKYEDTIDGVPSSTTANSGAFIAKYTSGGLQVWKKTLQSTERNRVVSVGVDEEDNIVALFQVYGDTTVDDREFAFANYPAMVVLGVGGNSSILWSQYAYPSVDSSVIPIAVSIARNFVIVPATLSGSCNSRLFSVACPSDSSVVLFRVNSNNERIAAISQLFQNGTSTSLLVSAVDIHSRIVYIMGRFAGRMYIDNLEVVSDTPESQSFFVSKQYRNGTVLNVTTREAQSIVPLPFSAFTKAGRLYALFEFTGKVIYARRTVTSEGKKDIQLVRYTALDAIVYVAHITSSSSLTSIGGIDVDDFRNVVLVVNIFNQTKIVDTSNTEHVFVASSPSISSMLVAVISPTGELIAYSLNSTGTIVTSAKYSTCGKLVITERSGSLYASRVLSLQSLTLISDSNHFIYTDCNVTYVEESPAPITTMSSMPEEDMHSTYTTYSSYPFSQTDIEFQTTSGLSEHTDSLTDFVSEYTEVTPSPKESVDLSEQKSYSLTHSCPEVNDCSGHGSCLTTFMCECHPGYTGDMCNEECTDVTLTLSTWRQIVYTSDLSTVTALLNTSDCYSLLGRDLEYTWTVVYGQEEHTFESTSPTVDVDFQQYGNSSFITVTAKASTSTYSVDSADSLLIHILHSVPTAILLDRNRTAALNSTVTLDGSGSFHRDKVVEGNCLQTFTWSCFIDNEDCGYWLEKDSTIEVKLTQSGLHKFTLKFCSCSLCSQQNVEVLVIETTAAKESLILTSFSSRYVSRMKLLYIEAAVDENIQSNWTVTNLSNGKVVTSSVATSRIAQSRYLVIDTSKLEASSQYSVEITVGLPLPNGTVESSTSTAIFETAPPLLPVVVNVEGTGHPFSITVNSSNADCDYFYYLADAKGKLFSLLDRTNDTQLSELSLPPGNFTIVVKVSDGNNELYSDIAAYTPVVMSYAKALVSVRDSLNSQSTSEISFRQLAVWSALLSYASEDTSLQGEIMLTKKLLIDWIQRSISSLQQSATDILLSLSSLAASPILPESTQLLSEITSSIIDSPQGLPSLNPGVTETALDVVSVVAKTSNSSSEVSQSIVNKIASIIISNMVPGQQDIVISNNALSMSLKKDYSSKISTIVTASSSVTFPRNLELPSNGFTPSIYSGEEDTVIGVQVVNYFNKNLITWSYDQVNSSVVTVRVTDQRGRRIFLHDLPDPLIIALMKNGNSSADSSVTCQYWEEDSEDQTDWLLDGCVFTGENSTYLHCACNHTTTFSAFISYDDKLINTIRKENNDSLYYAAILVQSILTIFMLACVAAVVFLFRYQPMRSRFIAPWVGVLSIMLDISLNGITRNSILVTSKSKISLNVLGHLVMVLSNPLSLLALYLFLWQQIRFCCLTYMYKSMATNTKVDRVIRFLTYKKVYLIMSLIIYAFFLGYFGLIAILGLSGVIKATSLTIVNAVSYEAFSTIIIVGVVVVIVWDLRHLKLAPIEKLALDERPSFIDRVFSAIYAHFITNDPLCFRIEAVAFALTVTAAYITYTVGIASAVKHNIYGLQITLLSLDSLFSVFKLIAFCGLVSLVTVAQYFLTKVKLNTDDTSDDMIILSVLSNTTLAKIFADYLKSEFSLENLHCLEIVRELRTCIEQTPNKVAKDTLSQLNETYLEPYSPSEVNIPGGVRKCCIDAITQFSNDGANSIDLLKSAIDGLYYALLTNLRDSFYRFRRRAEYTQFEKCITQVRELEDTLKIDHLHPQPPQLFNLPFDAKPA